MLFINFIYSQNSGSNFISTNPNAEIFDDNNQKIGNTPFDLKKLNKNIVKINIVKENFDTIKITLKEKRKDNMAFFNAIEECSSCLLDKGKNTEDLVLKMTKTFKETENTILVGIEVPIIKIDENQVLGELNGNKKKLKDKDIYRLLGYPENMEMRILNAFQNSYVNATFFSKKDSKKDVSNLQNPKIIFKPIVKNLNFKLSGKLHRDFSGPCFLECEWQVFDLSDLENPIKTFEIKTNYFRSGNNYELLLHDMIALSERELLEEESLHNLISTSQQKYLEKSKGSVIEIPLIQNRSYTNTSEMLKESVNSIVTVETEGKFGSGVFVTDNGYLITNYHVIEGQKPIFIKIDKDRKVKAELVKANKDFDLAILKVNANIKGLSFYDSDKTNLGEEVYAIGTPLDKKLIQTITKGIISGYREFNGVNFIQSDVSINSGNSGGPMLNNRGEIIGINTLKASGKNISGIGFSIPSNIVLKMLNIKTE
ncbi:hypothetical protein GCM10023230_07120 [Flavobacterium hankyongi]|uniref:Trypsin-like serine protease n=1 Tax=Flavobacterium hankyongi TaxID=1176532 RepID=A0ABP8ZPC3_9FLAO